MKRHAKKALTALKKIGAPVFGEDRGDVGYFGISAERCSDKLYKSSGNVEVEDHLWADYYGEFRGGCPWVDPDVEKILEDNGLFCEWQNPGCLAVYDV